MGEARDVPRLETLTIHTMESTNTATRVNGWSNRATWLFALEYAEIWDIPALLASCDGDTEYAAVCLRKSAWATLIRRGQYSLDGYAIVSTADILRAVDWVEIVETFTAEEEQ